MDYQNLPFLIAAILSSRIATLHELETVYDSEGAYNLLEVIAVDAYNFKIASKQ
jgi:hypothetical protein